MTRTRQEAQDDAIRAARGALTIGGVRHNAPGTNVTVSRLDGARQAVVVVTPGETSVASVWQSLRWGGTLECSRTMENPWRMVVWTREPVEVVDDGIPVEADGHEGDFEEMGDAAPQTIGVEFDRETASVVVVSLRGSAMNSRARADRLEARHRREGYVLDSLLLSSRNEADRLTAATEAIERALVEFDARVASVEAGS